MSVVTEVTSPADESPELADYRSHCRRWLAEHFGGRPVREQAGPETESDDGLTEARAVQATLFDGGFSGISWPVEYGGQGLTMEHQRVFNEECAPYEISTGLFVITLGMCAPTLLEHGTEAQRVRHIRPMLRGDEVWCQLFSEPGAGSDVAGLQTRAERDGDEWVINGQKVWTSGAHIADFGLLVARTDPDAVKHKGISMFVVDMHAPGVTVRPLRQMTGAAGFNEVFLDDVRLPAASLVGVQNQGWQAAISTLMNERVSIGAGGGGLGRRLGGGEFERVVAVAREAGRLNDPVVRQLLARVYADTRVLELLSDRIRADVKAGRAPGPEGSIAKLAGTELARLTAEVTLEIVGAPGQAWEPSDEATAAIAHALLAAPGNAIAGGTPDIMKNILGERVLGLPKEPSVDRDVPFRQLRSNPGR